MESPETPQYDATSDLLARTLDRERFSDRAYLRWFYGENPRGHAIEEHVDEGGRRIAHYAVLPTTFRTPAGCGPFIFSSNVATDPTIRRSGLFREMAEKVYARAANTGAPGLIGVGNDASTVVVVERFGWRSLGPMPVRICVPVARSRSVESIAVDAAFLASAEIETLAEDLAWIPAVDWVQHWDVPFLRWRLARPGARYVLHVGPDAVAVSTRTLAPARVPAAVLLKVFPRRNTSLPLDAGPYVAAASRAARAALCVYAGHNAHVTVRGVRPPRRLQPSPLNLVCKSFDESRLETGRFALDTFELLDMDAY